MTAKNEEEPTKSDEQLADDTLEDVSGGVSIGGVISTIAWPRPGPTMPVPPFDPGPCFPTFPDETM